MATVNDIFNEIDRIENAKTEIGEAITEKGVDVPAGTPIQGYPALVRSIPTAISELFWCTYGETPAADIVSALGENKLPIVTHGGRFYIFHSGGNGTLYFVTILSAVSYWVAVDEGSDAWTDSNVTLQDTAEKTDTLTGNEQDTNKYLSTKGTAAALSALQTLLSGYINELTGIVNGINALIPAQASQENKLADKNFVNSSIATNTANYISDNGQPFQSVADLEAYSGPLTNNDYAFVVGTDSAGNTTYTRYKYNANTEQWAEEYVLNNSSFTAEQWAAISSGITALLVQKLTYLPTEIVTYVAQTLTEAQKQQARQNIGATAPEIFWAIYGTTTAQEIDQAVADGKAVLCNYNNRIYQFTAKTATGAYTFNSIEADVVYRLAISISGNWSNTFFRLQQTSEKSQSIETDRTSTTKYPSVKAVFDALGKWGVVSQTQTWTPTTGANPRTYAMSNLVYGLIPQSNIDLYTAAGATFNETTGYFELNGLTDISYNEMRDIYIQTCDFIVLRLDRQYNFASLRVRTSLPYKSGTNVLPSTNYSWCFYDGKWEVLPKLGKTTVLGQCFRVNPYLRKIGNIEVSGITAASAFSNFTLNCYSLEEIELKGVKVDIDLRYSSLLFLSSVVYLVENADNTTAITITLHATAYARCQADTTVYTYNGQTYTGIIAYAAAKNITIASA